MAKIKEKNVRFDKTFGLAVDVQVYLTKKKTTALPGSILKKQSYPQRLVERNLEALCISVQFALVRGILAGRVQEWEGRIKRIPPERVVAYLTDRTICALDPEDFVKLNGRPFSRSNKDDWYHDFEEMIKSFVRSRHYAVILGHVCGFAVPKLAARGAHPTLFLGDEEIRPYILDYKEMALF